MEFKRPGEDLRSFQKFIQATLTRFGFKALKVDSVTQFQSILADTLRQPGSPTTTNNGQSTG